MVLVALSQELLPFQLMCLLLLLSLLLLCLLLRLLLGLLLLLLLHHRIRCLNACAVWHLPTLLLLLWLLLYAC